MSQSALSLPFKKISTADIYIVVLLSYYLSRIPINDNYTLFFGDFQYNIIK